MKKRKEDPDVYQLELPLLSPLKIKKSPQRQAPVLLKSQLQAWGLTWEVAADMKDVKIGGKRKLEAIRLENALKESRKRRMRLWSWRNEQKESEKK